MNQDKTLQPELISAYFDGEVTAAERAAVEKVLAESAEARAELAAYQVLSAALRGGDGATPTIDVSQAVLEAIAGERPEVRGLARLAGPANVAKGRFSRLLPLGFAAALAMVALIGIGWRMSFHVGPMEVPVADAELEKANEAQPPPLDSPIAESESSLDAMAEPAPPMARPESGGEAPTLADSPATASEAAETAPSVAGSLVDQHLVPGNMGNVYSFVDQTGAEEILVLRAQVRDLPGAMKHIQDVLTRNSIHSGTISPSEEFLGLAVGEAVPREDRAVYVESDAEQVKLALDDLQRELGSDPNAIVDASLAGVLVSDAQWMLRFAAPDGRGGMPGLGVQAEGMEGAGVRMRSVLPRSDSPPSQGMRAGEAGSSASTRGPVSSGLSRPMSAPVPDSQSTPAVDEERNEGFQTIVNVSNTLIQRQLRERSSVPSVPGSLDFKSETNTDSFAVPPQVPRPVPSESSVERGRLDARGGVGGGDMLERQNTPQARKPGERRLRMLVMLQQQPPQEAPKP